MSLTSEERDWYAADRSRGAHERRERALAQFVLVSSHRRIENGASIFGIAHLGRVRVCIASADSGELPGLDVLWNAGVDLDMIQKTLEIGLKVERKDGPRHPLAGKAPDGSPKVVLP